MSGTIQAPSYGARRAALLQKRPSTIINTAENYGAGIAPICSPPRGAHALFHIVLTGGVGVLICSTGTSSRPAPGFLDASHATTASEPVLEPTNYDAASWQRWSETTKAVLQKASVDSQSATSAAASMRVRRLNSIQAALGLPTRVLAQMLGISRQALYKWLDASNDLKLQEASRVRLAQVERIAKQWKGRTAVTLGTVVHEPLAGGGTLMEMLIADSVDEEQVTAAFGELLVALQGKPKTRSQKLLDAGFRRRAPVRALPSDE